MVPTHWTLGTHQVNSRAYVASFNFSGSDQQKLVGTLSGGERNRVHLAKTLTVGGNVILLDEPTNDLDEHAARALEDALGSFAGSAVVVSHDRWFLDRIATHILAFEGEGGRSVSYRQLKWTMRPTGASDWARRRRPLKHRALRPQPTRAVPGFRLFLTLRRSRNLRRVGNG